MVSLDEKSHGGFVTERHRRGADDAKLQPRVEAQISHRDPAGMDAAANAHLPKCGPRAWDGNTRPGRYLTLWDGKIHPFFMGKSIISTGPCSMSQTVSLPGRVVWESMGNHCDEMGENAT